MGVWETLVQPCNEANRWEALEVLYRRVPAPLRDRLIVEVLEEARGGELDLSGLWVALGRGGRVEGALLTQSLAGRAAAVWAPEIRTKWRRSALATALITAALEDLKHRGFMLAQAVLDESANPRSGRDLERGGMARITEFLYLERDVAAPLGFQGPVDFAWRSFHAAIEDEFRAVLAATYEGSLDMPELEGTRGLDEILEGYRAVGRFDPERWRLGRLTTEPEAAAVVLLAENPGREVWEVVYLGLTPAARHRGLGRVVIQHALDLAKGKAKTLELAVDERNKPARRLYESVGFTLRDRRTVHLAVLSRPDRTPAQFPA